MTPQTILAALLTLAVLLAIARLAWRQYRASERARWWRIGVLVVAQPIVAALLWFTLYPPTLPTRGGTLIVATRGAGSGTTAAGDHRVVLPESDDRGERVPDLGTALRRYPSARILVLGEGLTARDRDAVGARSLSFAPGPAPRGLVSLAPPPPVAVGGRFTVGGRVAGVDRGSVELVDPAGRVADRTALPESGDFALTGGVRVAGVDTFALRVRDAGKALVETATVPVVTVADPVPQVLLVAGAPSAEVRFVRRWATDAGLALATQVSAGGGVVLGDARVALTPATLARTDLLVLDERSWAALGGARGSVVAAVRGGMGLLLRVTGPLSDATRRDWRALGFAVTGGGEEAETAIDGAQVSRATVGIAAADGVPMLRDARGQVLARWRAAGRGRVAVWSVAGSFALVLEGREDAYEALWSRAFATLARAGADAPPQVDPLPQAGQRVRVCGAGGRILAPDGEAADLVVDPAAGCAGWWPQAAGWHVLQPPTVRPERRRRASVPTCFDCAQHEWDGAAGTPRGWPIYVQPAAALPALRATRNREATLRLVGDRSATATSARGEARRGSSWPWFLGWLIISAALWWFERRRSGQDASAISAAAAGAFQS